MSQVPKATLYTFDGSVWASAPRLALVEKGYAATDLDVKKVDLVKAENFDPSFLRINSKGTVPTLVVPLLETTSAEVDTKFRAINDTKAILEFLDKSRSQNTLNAIVSDDAAAPAPAPAPILAPATIEGKALSDELIRLVHQPTVDPNFLLLGARTEAELEAGKRGLPGTFVSNRYQALLAHQKALDNSPSTTAFDGSTNPKSSAVHENLKKWYADKIAAETLLVAAYIHADKEAVNQLVQLTNATWQNVALCLTTLEAKLAGPYALGDQISLADLHLVPWLARVAAIASGLVPNPDPLASIDSVIAPYNAKVGEKTKLFWQTFSERASFKTVYGDGLH